jgi:hypothetical protein
MDYPPYQINDKIKTLIDFCTHCWYFYTLHHQEMETKALHLHLSGVVAFEILSKNDGPKSRKKGNPKYEYRNPKQIQNPNFLMTQTFPTICFGFWSFDIVSTFACLPQAGISCFGFEFRREVL